MKVVQKLVAQLWFKGNDRAIISNSSSIKYLCFGAPGNYKVCFRLAESILKLKWIIGKRTNLSIPLSQFKCIVPKSKEQWYL